MWNEQEDFVFAANLLMQLVGLLGVIAARLTESANHGRSSNWLVLTCFLIVGATGVVVLGTAHAGGLSFAMTLPLMAVGATLDLRKVSHPAAF